MKKRAGTDSVILSKVNIYVSVSCFRKAFFNLKAGKFRLKPDTEKRRTYIKYIEVEIDQQLIAKEEETHLEADGRKYTNTEAVWYDTIIFVSLF